MTSTRDILTPEEQAEIAAVRDELRALLRQAKAIAPRIDRVHQLGHGVNDDAFAPFLEATGMQEVAELADEIGRLLRAG